jgi:hypothetical protein
MLDLTKTDWKRVYEQWYRFSEVEREEIANFLFKLSQKGKEELFEREPYSLRVYVEKLRCFDEEDHLLLWLYLNESGEKYPKVTIIARTKLTPDIDLLRIEKQYGKEPVVIGYEAKILGRKRIFDPFYAGLGEVLCYFRYGINQAWLVTGVPNDVPENEIERLKETWKFLKDSRVIPAYIGLRIIREKHTPENVDTPQGEFYVSSFEYAKYMRESLLKKQFTWSKTFIKV